jgi:ATP-dependent DNA ligase
LRERLVLLERLLDGAQRQLTLCPQTSDIDTARVWLETWPDVDVEGIVCKGADQRRQPGISGWGKLRHMTSTEAIIDGVTGTFARPETLLLGRRDEQGVSRYVGRTRPLTDMQRRELAGALRPPKISRQKPVHTLWPQPLAASWLGQLGKPAEALTYLPIEPDLIAEIEVDTAHEPVATPPGPAAHDGATHRNTCTSEQTCRSTTCPRPAVALM